MKTWMSIGFCLFFSGPGWADTLKFQDLRRVLEDPSRNIRSVDQLLEQPEISKSFRSHYTLMFNSRSLQGADGLNPRAIIYGQDAKLVMTFNAAPGDRVGSDGDLRGANALEVMNWVEETHSFEFHSITFPEQSSQGSVQISETNPRICMACHMGPDPRPNWSPYFTWPGAYGGNDDYVGNHSADGEDREQLAQFLKTAGTRPRYRALENLADGFTPGDSGDRQKHNTVFTAHLSKLNAARIFSRIKQKPYYDDIKYAVDLQVHGLHRFSKELEQAGLTEISELADDCTRPKYSGPRPTFQTNVSEVVRLFAAFDPADISWFMTFGPTLKDELVSPGSVEQDFIDAIQTQDPTLKYEPDELARAAAGWVRLSKTLDLRSALKKCAESN